MSDLVVRNRIKGQVLKQWASLHSLRTEEKTRVATGEWATYLEFVLSRQVKRCLVGYTGTGKTIHPPPQCLW